MLYKILSTAKSKGQYRLFLIVTENACDIIRKKYANDDHVC